MDEWYKKKWLLSTRDYMYSIRKKKKEILTCRLWLSSKKSNEPREDVFYEEKILKI